MRSSLIALALGTAVLATNCGTAAAATVTIDVSLDSPDVGHYRLTGQSAFIMTQTSSGTSGGQLDGVESPGASISFDDIFPPADLGDYVGFGYLGIIETLDDSDDVIDTSLIVAFVSGFGLGETITNTFPYAEGELVTAFTTSSDSPQFLDMLDLVGSGATTLGMIAIPPIGRPGTSLDLVAFIGGREGELGVKVGTLAVTVVPEPGTLGLLLVGAMTLLVSRRRR